MGSKVGFGPQIPEIAIKYASPEQQAAGFWHGSTPIIPGQPWLKCSTTTNAFRCCADSNLAIEDSHYGGTLHLSWEPPLDTGGTAITSYKLYSLNADGSQSLTMDNIGTDKKSRNVDVVDLKALTTYAFSVASVNKGGIGALSTQLSASTAAATPPKQPSVTKIGASGDSITVSVVVPDRKGGLDIDGVRVQRVTPTRRGCSDYHPAWTSYAGSATGLCGTPTTYPMNAAHANAPRLSWSNSNDQCNSIGARLCTSNEIKEAIKAPLDGIKRGTMGCTNECTSDACSKTDATGATISTEASCVAAA